MNKATASVLPAVLFLFAACGGGAPAPKASLVPAGTGWFCTTDGDIHSCWRTMEKCTEVAKGKGECVANKSAHCMTYQSEGSETFTCFDDHGVCNKFCAYMKKKGAKDISYCAEQN